MNCLECGEKIIGRSDKKFCNDACRNAYNNKQNKDSTNLMRNINNKLRKNYRILVETNIEGKTKANRSKLESLGFDFDYFTSLKVYKNGSEYRFIYDYGYKLLEDDFVLIVKISHNFLYQIKTIIMKEIVLITGANGMIARELAGKIENEYELRFLTRKKKYANEYEWDVKKEPLRDLLWKMFPTLFILPVPIFLKNDGQQNERKN